MRLDTELVSRKLFKSRQKAKEAILQGRVMVNGKVCLKPSENVMAECAIETERTDNDYVGRGGLKLEKMMTKHSIELTGTNCIDIGASTGGFTQCMLRYGAKFVYAVDVGTGQLDEVLKSDKRVSNMEKTDIRQLTRSNFSENIGFISVDVSFISLKLIFPKVWEFLDEGGKAVCLVKPQFEAGRKNIGKNGIVKSQKVREQVVRDITNTAKAIGFTVTDTDISPITGGSGNIEYLLMLEKPVCHPQQVSAF